MRVSLAVFATLWLCRSALAQEALTPAQVDEFKKAIIVDVDRQKQLIERDHEIDRLKAEIARLRSLRPDGDTQLIVSARFIEVSTAQVKASSLDGTRSVLVPFLDPKLKERPFPRVNSLPIFLCGAEHPLPAQIDRWLTDPTKPAKVLGSPTASTLLHQEGFIRLGHEFPITVPLSLGATTIEHRFYGLQLSFVGSLQTDGRLSLEVRPRHSEVDQARSVKINGEEVPGLTVRECAMKILMRPDEQVVIGGMTRMRTVTTQPARLLLPAKTATEETELLIVLSVAIVPGDGTQPGTAAKPTPAVSR